MSAPWVQLRNGEPFDLLAPTVEQARAGVDAMIAAICRIERYTGHSSGWTVGEHSLLVADILSLWGAPAVVIREGLVHDVPEGVYGDISSPVQWALRTIAGADDLSSPLDTLRANVDHVVRAALMLPDSEHPHVKRADLVALAIERRDVMTSCARDWNLPEYALTSIKLTRGCYGWSPEEVETAFRRRLAGLDAAIADAAVTP